MHPEFSQFKPIQLEDRDFIQEILWKYQPQTSELTFTNLFVGLTTIPKVLSNQQDNLFIWRLHYGLQWSIYRDWLLVLCTADANSFYALQPVGPPSRLEVTHMLLQWFREEKGEKEPHIERADQRLISEIKEAKDLLIEPIRDHFDYVYRSEDLIQLAGRKYHSKRNHINKFLNSYSFTYVPLSDDYMNACLELTESWCQLHRCEEDLNLLGEWEAVRETLVHFRALRIQGGVILIENNVEAFALGELLNNQTAVVHIEKANVLSVLT